ncbi:MAG: FAD-dependent oxidoreductase [Gammaproteobacteria bacterium]
MDKDQIIIIGGGLIGLATANALLDRGEKVLVLERNAETATAASFANAGMLTPSQSTPWNSPSDIANILSGVGRKDSPMSVSFGTIPSYFFWGLRFMLNSTPSKFERISKDIFSLAKYSKDLTVKIRNLEEFTYDESTDGTIKLFRDSERFEKSIALSNRIYAESNVIDVLNQKEVIELEPALNKVRKGLIGGIHYKEDEIGDAYKFCKALEGIIRNKGGRILVNSNIKKILLNKGKVNSVVTDRAVLQAKRVVICAGSWSPVLLKETGIRIPVKPVKGYSLTYNTAGIRNTPKLSVIDESIHIAITPYINRIRVAGTAEFVGFNDEVHPKRVDYLNSKLNEVYPHIFSKVKDDEEAEMWFGFRPMSADGLPFVGESKVKGLYLNTGHGHLGWTLAMGSADLLADQIVGAETQIDSEPYQANR